MGFAADSTAGTTLKGYGIIVGDENGNLNEDQNLNRAEMMVVLARMMGKGAEAQAFALPSTFTDLAGFGWAVPWIAYAEMNDWTEGKGANMFDPAGNVTAQEAAVFMLKALGYEADVDFNWTNAVEFATAKGLFAGVSTPAQSPILRGDLFTMMITTLNTEVKSGAGKLGIVLGYMEVEVLEVEKVSATNLIQVVVEFNGAEWADEDEVTDVENYTLEDEDEDDIMNRDGVAAAVVDVEVNGKVVTLTLNDAVAQQTEAVLVISDEVLPSETKFDFEFLDTKLPKAISAKVIGNDTIKVTFDEPIDESKVDNADFEVEDGDFFIKDIDFVNNNTEANIELYSELEEGTVKVEVGAGVVDYAGFGVLKTSFDVKVVEDTEAPYVTGYKDAKANSITLIFNEDIEINEDYDPADSIYHTNTNNMAKLITADSISGNQLKLVFEEGEELPNGTSYIYILKDSVNDLWDNTNAKIIVTVTVTPDTTKPVVEKIKVVDEQKIEVTFSEALDPDTALDFDNYSLLKNGSVVEDMITGVSFKNTTDNDVIVVLFDEDLSGKYALVIEKVEDPAGNVMSKATVDFTVDDMTAPGVDPEFSAKLYNAERPTQLIVVRFGEAMATSGRYAINDLEKYVLVVDSGEFEGEYDLADVDNVTIAAVDGNKAVEIKIPASEIDLLVGSEDYNIIVSRVADAAGNYTAQLAYDLDIAPAGSVNVTKVNLTTSKKIEVTFDDELKTVDSDDIKFYREGTTTGALAVSRVSAALNSDGNTVLTFTLVDEVGTDVTIKGTEDKINFVLVNDTDKDGVVSKNKYNESVAPKTVQVADKAAPEVEEVYYVSGDAIVVEFTEALDSTTVASMAKNGFTTTGGTYYRSALLDDPRFILLMADEEESDFTRNTNVYYNKVAGIADTSINENEVASFSFTDALVIKTTTNTAKFTLIEGLIADWFE
jgi:hypothetical protein